MTAVATKKLKLYSPIRLELETATGTSFTGRTSLRNYREILIRKVISLDPDTFHALGEPAKQYVKYAVDVINSGGPCPEFTDVEEVFQGRTLARSQGKANGVINTKVAKHGATGRIRELMIKHGFGMGCAELAKVLRTEGFVVAEETIKYTRSEFRRSCRALEEAGLLTRKIQGV